MNRDSQLASPQSHANGRANSHFTGSSYTDTGIDMNRFQHLRQADPEGALLLRREMSRDMNSLNLSAPESYMTLAVREALGAPLPPSEGYPDRRYHSGRHIVNEIEELCWRRALETFDLSAETWGVNVQAFSGSLANLYTYTALLEPGDTLFHMDLSHGGHLSHGHQTSKRKVSESAFKFNAVAYHVNLETGIIDYDGLHELAQQHKPKIITVGGSSYSRLIDYETMRKIADDVGALLHCDMAHFCGLVAGRAIPSPFPHCHVVTTTTYKSFCGPKGAIIFYRSWMKDKINSTVFPRYQAARDYSVVLAISVALRQSQSSVYREQQRQVVEASRMLAASLIELGYTIVGGGTDTHMVIIDLRPRKIDAAVAEKALELINIICNQNSIPGDQGGNCSGLRLGTPPMVLRGMPLLAFNKAAVLIHQALEITHKIQAEMVPCQQTSACSRQSRRVRILEQFVAIAQKHSMIEDLKSQVAFIVSAHPPPWHERSS
ncbi:serine hydroxymethyltransferase-like protein [Colletotrichum lupini]|nr:serine hydroxymethyltransferase-like protein [Colletotrichum lupini]